MQAIPWFSNEPFAEVDAREGGSYRIDMEDKDGKTCSPRGVYE